MGDYLLATREPLKTDVYIGQGLGFDFDFSVQFSIIYEKPWLLVWTANQKCRAGIGGYASSNDTFFEQLIGNHLIASILGGMS